MNIGITGALYKLSLNILMKRAPVMFIFQEGLPLPTELIFTPFRCILKCWTVSLVFLYFDVVTSCVVTMTGAAVEGAMKAWVVVL